MPDLWMDVDIALSEVPVNIFPLLDDTDFKSRETSVAYNATGMDLVWNFITTGGAFTQTAVTPTSGGDYDWTHQGDGIYTIEIPASGGASINNDTEGFGWFTGIATGVLPWRGPIIGFRAAALNNALIDGGDELDVNVTKIADTSQTGRDLGLSVLLSPGTGTGQIDITSGVVKANLSQILGTALTETAGQIAAAFKKFFDKAGPTGTINSLPDAIPGASGGLPTTNGTKINQTADLTAGQEIAANLTKVNGAAQTATLDTIKGDTAAILTDTGTTLDGKINTIDGIVDEIKAKTDKMNFTSGNDLDVNVQKVNDTALTGDGSVGAPWGPA